MECGAPDELISAPPPPCEPRRTPDTPLLVNLATFLRGFGHNARASSQAFRLEFKVEGVSWELLPDEQVTSVQGLFEHLGSCSIKLKLCNHLYTHKVKTME
ncbi:unnamed protein product [Colias eurytheme]|nr:unnamed protein product [Colias eurytheme]